MGKLVPLHSVTYFFVQYVIILVVCLFQVRRLLQVEFSS
jgi:hypothetical protein